jgi:hypothetical protein
LVQNLLWAYLIQSFDLMEMHYLLDCLVRGLIHQRYHSLMVVAVVIVMELLAELV